MPRSPKGVNHFVTEIGTTFTVHTFMCNNNGYSRYAVQLTGSAPDASAGIYAQGCQIILAVTGVSYNNTAADGLAPTWISSSAVGGGVVQIGKLIGANMNGPLQVTMALSTVTGTYVAGETVTDGTSGATGIVVVGGTTSIVVKTIVGTFGAHTVTGGTSGATGTWVSNTNLSTVDQQIVLNDGATVVFPTSFIVTNASTSLTTASGLQIYNQVGRTGTEIGHTAALSGLTTSAKVLNGTMDNTTTTVSALFATLTTAQGGAATADIYVYGYILA